MTFKEKLVILRKAKGLTQDEFAAAVGVSRQAVYKWECGQSYPEVPKLLEMKLLLSISIDELLDDSIDIPIPEKKKRKRISKEAAAQIENNVRSTIGVQRVTPAPAPKAAPVAPKAAPVAPKAAPAPAAAPAYRPAPKAVPTPPVYSYSAPVTAKPIAEEAPAPKVAEEERTVFIPAPSQIENYTEETVDSFDDDKTETKKSGLFGRIFGRK